MNDPSFNRRFEAKREFRRGLSVATISIECPVELYLSEVYACLALGTSKWNRFRTH